MENNEVISLELQLRTDRVEAGINKVSDGIVGLQATISSVGNQLADVFYTIQVNADMLTASIRKMEKPIANLASALKLVADSDVGVLTSELTNLNHILNDTFEQQQKHHIEDLVSDYVSSGVDAAQLGVDIYNLLNEKKKKSKGGNKGGIKVKVRKKGSGDKATGSESNGLGIAAGGIGTAMGLDAMDGIMGDLLSDAAEGGGLTAMFSNLSTVVADAGQKMREFGSAIGTAFSNFGSAIAQLAASTGTWIANTASKVANTAAQRRLSVF